jgi:hypothetical protein
MMNPFRDVDWKPDLAKKRKFAESLMIGFPVLGIFFALVAWFGLHRWNPIFLWIGLIGLLLGLVLWLVPAVAHPFYLVWHFVACCMGFVIGNMLLIAFYYLVITPIGLCLRGLGKLSLQKSFNKNAPTYWRDVEKKVDLQRYYRQF